MNDTQIHSARHDKCLWLTLLTCLLTLVHAGTLAAQGVDPSNRPVAEVRIQGLKDVPEQLARNAIRVNPGDPYNNATVEADVVRLNHLGRFRTVKAEVAQNPDGSIILTYVVTEQRLIQEVGTSGGKEFADQEILAAVGLRKGDPVDQFAIDQGITRIKEAYKKKGFFMTDVEVDQQQLDESGILIFKIREGPKVRLRKVQFEGNTAFSDKELKSKIQSSTYMFILRDGAVSREQLEDDAERLRDYYRERGYLDAQVGRRIDLSDDQRDANVVFEIEEGKLYTVDTIKIAGNELFTEQQILEGIALKVGDIFSADRLRKSQKAVDNMYGKLGFIEAKIDIERFFDENTPTVDVTITIAEGQPYTVGAIEVRGNQITKSRVVLRQVRGMDPGRRFDKTGVELTERRLKESPLFEKASVTILGATDDEIRDVLVEVVEKNSGSLSFGAGVSSDAGVIGAIDLVQRNFDIADPPDSFNEFITGKGFRGAGQYFAISIQPGDEVSRYSVSFREPYLLDSNFFLDTNIFFFERERRDYDEQRMGGSLGLGQRFGDVWSAAVRGRAETVDITNVDDDAPTEVFSFEDDESLLTALGISVSRSTTDSRIFPTTGSRLSLGLNQFGALGGDYDFTSVTATWDKFWTVDEDFLGRKTVFSMKVDTGYIFSEAPFFERFYAGGHRSFRGFEYRGIGPRDTTGVPPGTVGTVSDTSIGGEFLFLVGFEYNFPIYQDILRMVVFTDTGTVDEDIDFSNYRASVGAGLRLQLPMLGQAPFAFDFAIPVMKDKDDDTQIFSFDIALPF